eukprot:6209806-Pleurochrysis_carterae.AAC.2
MLEFFIFRALKIACSGPLVAASRVSSAAHAQARARDAGESSATLPSYFFPPSFFHHFLPDLAPFPARSTQFNRVFKSQVATRSPR